LECNGHQEEVKLLLGERRCERRKRCNGHREEQSEFEVKVAGSLRQDKGHWSATATEKK